MSLLALRLVTWLLVLGSLGPFQEVNGQWVDPPPKYDCPKRPLYPCQCIKGSEEGVYVHCNNTNIASLSVGLRQIRTLIHTLTIDNCNMEKIYGDLYNSLTVKILNIKDTPIKDISENTFEGVIANGMEELHLHNTWLTRLPPSIQNLTQLKFLDVETSRISFSQMEFSKACKSLLT